MRWNKKQKPQDGETREVTKFLWLPVCIENQVRWLETATISQTYWKRKPLSKASSYWSNNAWVDGFPKMKDIPPPPPKKKHYGKA